MEEEDATEPKNTISEGFELAAYDIETLQRLCEQFDEPPLPPKKRGRKPKPPPPRKKCEVDLHQTLCALFEDLEKYEVSFSKLLSKAKIKIMKESQEPEPEEEPGTWELRHLFFSIILQLNPFKFANLWAWFKFS